MIFVQSGASAESASPVAGSQASHFSARVASRLHRAVDGIWSCTSVSVYKAVKCVISASTSRRRRRVASLLLVLLLLSRENISKCNFSSVFTSDVFIWRYVTSSLLFFDQTNDTRLHFIWKLQLHLRCEIKPANSAFLASSFCSKLRLYFTLVNKKVWKLQLL